MSRVSSQHGVIFTSLVLLFCFSSILAQEVREETGAPNVLILFVDDLGYGDLGSYGNNSISSPNIDKRIAEEGVKFTQWISASSMCTPSRGSLLTGRQPIRLGLASTTFRTRVFGPISVGGLPHSELTLAEALKDRGYATHMTGKWHLGIGHNGTFLPHNHGFDEFYGLGITNVQSCLAGKTIYRQATLPGYIWHITGSIWTALLAVSLSLHMLGLISRRSLAAIFGLIALLFSLVCLYARVFTLINPNMCVLYRNSDIVQQPFSLQNLTQRLTADAAAFIAGAEAERRPWFLYMSYAHVHTALFNNPEFTGTGGSEYGDNIAEMDWSVGRLLDVLEDLSALDNTIVWFSSDNGPFTERHAEGGSPGPLKGGKGQVWEGGIRVPGMVRFPRLLPRGAVSDEPVSSMDVFPTTIALVDRLRPSSADWREPRKPAGPLDGFDITSAVQSGEGSPHRDGMVHYCATTLAAVRIRGRYKVVFSSPVYELGEGACPDSGICGCEGEFVEDRTDEPLVYDLRFDIGENKPIDPKTEEYTLVVKEANRLKREHLRTIQEHPNQENQMDAGNNPLYLPCCNFPYCACDLER